MIRVIVEIDDDAFGAVSMSEKVDKTISQMTDEELVELLLDRDTDLEDFTTIVEIRRPTDGRSLQPWRTITRDIVAGIARTMNHPQSRPRYSRRG